MDLLNFIGAVSGCSAIVGFFAMLVRLGEWKARQEERLASHGKRIDSIEGKQDAVSNILYKNNEILAQIKVKVDMMYKERSKRSKG